MIIFKSEYVPNLTLKEKGRIKFEAKIASSISIDMEI